MANTKRFLVTGSYISKKTKKAMSNVAEISSGINALGHKYELADTRKFEPPIEGTYKIGSILEATISFGEALKPSETFTAPPKA